MIALDTMSVQTFNHLSMLEFVISGWASDEKENEIDGAPVAGTLVP